MARFCRRTDIKSAMMREAVERAARGLVDADLGGGIIKQRVARPGQGRSGGFRVLLAYRSGDRAVFLYGFAKGERDNITMARSRLTDALLETAGEMRRVGLLDEKAHQKITLRHLDSRPAVAPLSGGEIRRLRQRERLSQAVLARYLNLTAGYVSQMERGLKAPSGPALVLLDVIRRKGIEAIR